MHAYLFVGQDLDLVELKAKEFGGKLGKSNYSFSLTKIDEVRELARFVKFSFEEPTCIYLKGLGEATEEALNAFLKNLEEPQKNLYYILIATSENNLIPTIVSRCQIVRVAGRKSLTNDQNLMNFLELSLGKKFSFVDSIKKREEAIDFLQNLTVILHSYLVEGKCDFKEVCSNLSLASYTHLALQRNGNIALHLTNFTINLKNFEFTRDQI